MLSYSGSPSYLSVGGKVYWALTHKDAEGKMSWKSTKTEMAARQTA